MDQLSLWDFLEDAPKPFKIDNKIRLIELFAGVGSQAMALKRLGADFEHYRVVEFDPYPLNSYNAIHHTNFEPLDITKVTGLDLQVVDVKHFTYLLTYSFPCQSLSIAGKGHGMKKGSGTRSGLLWEVERLLKECEALKYMDINYGMPQVLIMENVPQVHSSKNIDDFRMWLEFLESLGYKNYWQDLNAKDYGVAQNRNRCFCVSIYGNYKYEFPKPIELNKVMADYLEPEVDERYFLSKERTDRLIGQLVADGKLD